MNGFRVFKYYTAIKLHFANDKFDVFTNKGHVRGSVDTFYRRNDRMLFEKIARNHPTDKECIQFIAANFMYDHTDLVYDLSTSEMLYQEYLRRRQSITKVFADDLDTIVRSGAEYDQYEFLGHKIPDVVQLFMAKKITLETMSILNDMDGIVDKLNRSTQMSLMMENDLRRIRKSKGFVKYDSRRVMAPYLNFLEEIQGHTYGQDIPSFA